MSQTSFYSVHNDLGVGRDELIHIQLNPAVVLSGSEEAFSLSIVCIGPRLVEDDSIELGIEVDGRSSRCEALHCRTEDSGNGLCLTVAVFPASRSLLERLGGDPAAAVSLTSGARRNVHRLSDQNRRNLVRFLEEVGRRDATPSAQPRLDPVAV